MSKRTVNKFDTSLCKPLGDTIIAEPFDRITMIDGIMIAEEKPKEETRSVVRAIGPKVKKVRVGDVIFHSQYAGSEAAINEKPFLILRESRSANDLFGIYHGNRPIDIDPTDDRILIEWEEGKQEYQGTNIIKSGADKDRHYTGIILALGPDVENTKDLKPGKRVFFNQFCGPERVDYQGKRYAFINEYDIFCLVPARTDMMVRSE